jgi:antitoxin HicB
MSSNYHIEVDSLPPDEGGGFVAWVPDLPGCMSDGATPAEAIANATKAIDEWIMEAMRLSRAVPAPGRRRAAMAAGMAASDEPRRDPESLEEILLRITASDSNTDES